MSRICKFASGSNSMVECNLAKVDVAGSSPVSRFGKFRALKGTARLGTKISFHAPFDTSIEGLIELSNFKAA
jgi:hypothetical protein